MHEQVDLMQDQTRILERSPRLGFNLESIRSDPRLGTQKFTITELDTVDPDPQLFRVPEGYQVVDQQTNPPVAW